jgi:L-asparaginase
MVPFVAADWSRLAVSKPAKPKVAFIGTGGTISSLGIHPLELQDYGVHNNRMHASAIVARFPDVKEVAEVIPVDFRNTPSPDIYFPEWQALAALCSTLAAQHRDLAGIVIGHGTATLEETAYFLNLVLKVPFPVVMIGSQRPASGISTDAAINLLNGVRVAASPDSRGRGVLLMLNDEIQAAREVTKTSNWRMQTFRTPDFGALGHADADRIAYYRRPERTHMPDTEFDVTDLKALPRVDIVYAYPGSDGTAVKAFVAAGAKGIVSAGFAPGSPPPADLTALAEAVKQGVTVVQSSRAGSGRVYRSKRLTDAGILSGDNLNPQKARLLLALALTKTSDPAEIARMFSTY